MGAEEAPALGGGAMMGTHAAWPLGERHGTAWTLTNV